jgi:hypothetical protein
LGCWETGEIAFEGASQCGTGSLLWTQDRARVDAACNTTNRSATRRQGMVGGFESNGLIASTDKNSLDTPILKADTFQLLASRLSPPNLRLSRLGSLVC